jgi:hypothetical protein
MKKHTTKLVVRRETIRALASVDLARVAGGDAAPLVDSGDFHCPAQVAAKPALGG